MKKDIRLKIINVFGAVSSLAVIFFFFTLWLFSYNSVDQPLKEAWLSSISFLAVLATLAAAYIAAYLFNDWRDIQRGISKAELSKETIVALIKLKADADRYYVKAQFHAKAYELQYDKDISKYYTASLIEKAKKSQGEKEEYNAYLKENLNIFFEKIDLYEAVFNESLLDPSEREYNFKTYFFSINSIFSNVILADESLIQLSKNTASEKKIYFEQKYYKQIIDTLKSNINLKTK